MVVKARDTGPKAATRAVVYRRCGATSDWPGWCEWPGCTRARTDVQHRLGRKDGGRFGAMAELLNGAAWLLGVCRAHHEAITSACGVALARARESGWVLTEGQDATQVPVLTRHHDAPVLLDDTGSWVPTR